MPKILPFASRRAALAAVALRFTMGGSAPLLFTLLATFGTTMVSFLARGGELLKLRLSHIRQTANKATIAHN